MMGVPLGGTYIASIASFSYSVLFCNCIALHAIETAWFSNYKNLRFRAHFMGF